MYEEVRCQRRACLLFFSFFFFATLNSANFIPVPLIVAELLGKLIYDTVRSYSTDSYSLTEVRLVQPVSLLIHLYE